MPIDYKSLPKIELHCHLDASLRVSTVAELGRKIGLTLPNPLEPALVAPECCIDLADYLVRIDLALEVMQQRDHLVRIGREVVEDLAADGVIYGEIRFAPQLHLRDGLSMQEVLHAVHEVESEGTMALRESRLRMPGHCLKSAERLTGRIPAVPAAGS
jgi:adenosine deaminase